MTAQVLGLYDENIFFHWTFGEWLNRIKGARLAVIDRHELAVQAAWVSGMMARPTKGRPPQPKKFFDAKAARNEVLNGSTKQTSKKADFTFYNKAVEGLKKFDWAAHYVPADKDKK